MWISLWFDKNAEIYSQVQTVSKSTKPVCGKMRPGDLQWARKEWKKEDSGSLAAARFNIVRRRDGEPARREGNLRMASKGPRVQD